MADFVNKKCYVNLSRVTVSRILKCIGWTKKVTQSVAKEQNQDLHDDYIDRRSYYKPEQMIFIDESGSDCGLAILDRGYAPKGVTPVQFKRFHHGKRVQILPDYTLDGVIVEKQPPYSPNLNPIEYLFGSIKNRIRKRHLEDKELIQGDFKSYLEMQVYAVGQDMHIARGHFRKAQIYVH